MTVKLRSVRLEFRFSFFAVLALMLLLCDERVALICLAASLLHEGGHLLAMRLFGCKVRAVCFGAAGVAIERGGPVSPCGEVCIALGGVAVNALLALAAFAAFRTLRDQTLPLAVYANLLLAALNLLPVYPLDASRALAAGLGRRISPEKLGLLLGRVSLATAAAVTGGSCFYFRLFGWNPSLLAVCVYLLFLNLKRSTSDV